jgi:hypothetical protein
MRPTRIAACFAVLVWTALLVAAETPTLSPDQWRQDLRFFARELPKRHISAYHYTPQSRFETAVSDLDKKLAGMEQLHEPPIVSAWLPLTRSTFSAQHVSHSRRP